MKEHMEVPLDTSNMSEAELQFHYFKVGAATLVLEFNQNLSLHWLPVPLAFLGSVSPATTHSIWEILPIRIWVRSG